MFVLFSLMALIALYIETALSHLLPIGVLIPNLIVILAVDLGLRYHGALGAFLAFAMGYATDAFSGTHLGVNACLITLVFFMSFEISRRLLVTNAGVGAVAVFFGAILTSIGGLALSSGSGALGEAGPLMPWLGLQALITAILAPFIFSLLARCKRAVGLPAGPSRE